MGSAEASRGGRAKGAHVAKARQVTMRQSVEVRDFMRANLRDFARACIATVSKSLAQSTPYGVAFTGTNGRLQRSQG